MLTAEATEGAPPPAAVKLHAPHQTSPLTTATPLAQRISVIAAVAGVHRTVFDPTEEETTLNDTADFTPVSYIIMFY